VDVHKGAVILSTGRVPSGVGWMHNKTLGRINKKGLYQN